MTSWSSKFRPPHIAKPKESSYKKIIRVVNDNDPDSEIYLCGYQDRGDAQGLSDWDLLILLNRRLVPFEVETKFMDELYEIELETGEIISLLRYFGNECLINHSITPYSKTFKEKEYE
ncbi:MAG: nucleotidyltransferase domain-containing protein [Bacteroidales bacterium]|nr:nucleotidyltransferase domain-containing protein [Bacteroidales bacterium]